MCEHFVVPSIRSREVGWAQRPSVPRCEDALKALDPDNSSLGRPFRPNIRHKGSDGQAERQLHVLPACSPPFTFAEFRAS